MAEIYLAMHRYDEAKEYIKECERTEKDSHLRQVFGYKNWCCYYAAIGEKEKALKFAKLLLENVETVNEDKLTAFTSYQILCESMLALGNGECAGQFLRAMEEVCHINGFDQTQALEDILIRHTLLFAPEEEHGKVYRRFYEKNQMLRAKSNETIASAMKSKILLDQLTQKTELMQSEQENLKREVDLDKLTGLYSRNFLETIMRMLKELKVSVLSFVILDVDYFKEYNDYYGHMKGDDVLREIASCLLAFKQEGIHVCRYGGDEFVCICIEQPAEKVEAYIRQVQDRLHTKALPHETSLCSDEVTLSIGYVVADNNTPMEAHLLLQLADQALYESKRSGRNAYTRKRTDIS